MKTLDCKEWVGGFREVQTVRRTENRKRWAKTKRQNYEDEMQLAWDGTQVGGLAGNASSFLSAPFPFKLSCPARMYCWKSMVTMRKHLYLKTAVCTFASLKKRRRNFFRVWTLMLCVTSNVMKNPARKM